MNKWIDAQVLHLNLVHAAQVRSLVTMAMFLPALGMAVLLGSLNSTFAGVAAISCFFGIPIIISSVVTEWYCIPKVKCPHCGESLWYCGTNSFKPRKMRLRDDKRCCPGCETPIL